MMRQLHTASGVERVYHLRLNGVKRLIFSAEMHQTSGFVSGTEYPYPTGDSPIGANCLSECEYRPPVSYSDQLDRGIGPAPVGSTKRGVNGLYDMGANVWEWVDGVRVIRK